MKKLLASKTFRILLALFAVVFAAESFIDPIQKKDLRDIKVSYAPKKIYLDIYLNRPISCEKLMSQADVKPFDVKYTTYFPTCETFDGGLRITFTETYRI